MTSVDFGVLCRLHEVVVEVGIRGNGNLRIDRLIELVPASGVFTCSLPDRFLSSFKLHMQMPHMTLSSNS